MSTYIYKVLAVNSLRPARVRVVIIQRKQKLEILKDAFKTSKLTQPKYSIETDHGVSIVPNQLKLAADKQV